MEATYIDLIFDTFQDLLSKAMPYLNEDDNDKKVIVVDGFKAVLVIFYYYFVGYVSCLSFGLLSCLFLAAL